jgi:ABC-type uncharacterized transport system permease subunit
MRELLWICFTAAALGYLAAGALFIDLIRRQKPRPFATRFAGRFLKIGLLAHVGYQVLDAIRTQECPMFSLRSALGMVSLAGVVAYTIMARNRRLDALGVLVSSAAVFFLIAAQTVGDSVTPDIAPWLIALHITSNLVGSGILLVAGGASLFYLLQARRLKNRVLLGQGPRLPALDVLDNTVHRLLWIGVPILTLGMLTGRFVVKQMGAMTSGDHLRAILSGVAWGLLVIALVLRQALDWRGRRSAYLTVAGTLGVLVVVVLYILRALGVMK